MCYAEPSEDHTLPARNRIGAYIYRIFRRRLYKFLPENRFLNRVRGVVHLARMWEKTLYVAFGPHVLWIEPIPTVFETLALSQYEALVLDAQGSECGILR
jgi:hypothetical protein